MHSFAWLRVSLGVSGHRCGAPVHRIGARLSTLQTRGRDHIHDVESELERCAFEQFDQQQAARQHIFAGEARQPIGKILEIYFRFKLNTMCLCWFADSLLGGYGVNSGRQATLHSHRFLQGLQGSDQTDSWVKHKSESHANAGTEEGKVTLHSILYRLIIIRCSARH